MKTAIVYSLIALIMTIPSIGGISAQIGGDYHFLNEFYKKCVQNRCIPQIRMRKQYVGDSEELAFEVEMRPEDVVLLHIYRE